MEIRAISELTEFRHHSRNFVTFSEYRRRSSKSRLRFFSISYL